jgi:two-component sensor histidine kinase/CHASE3 domain sensor protein
MTDATTQLGTFALPKREGRRRVAIVISLILVLLAAGSALIISRGIDSQLADISKSYDIRQQARELMAALVDAETGQRGYLLTMDQQYLAPYRTADAALDATYRGLGELVADDALRAAEVAALQELIAEKRAEMQRTITLAEDGKIGEALTEFRSNEGRAIMDQLRARIRNFVSGEDAKLTERNSNVEQPRQLLVGAIILALAGAAALAFMLFSSTQRQVSRLSRTSDELRVLNEELEEHVRARTAELEVAREYAERERARVEALLQETNHRIGNSLATVSSLLGLQVARSRSDDVRQALDAAQSRVHAIASGHRRLRLGADLETTNAAEFLEAVLEDIATTQTAGRDVSFEGDFEPLVINARDATTLGIVVGELVTNAMKHAFPDGRKGRIWCRLYRDRSGQPTLVVEDDGRGVDPAEVTADVGLGATIIRQLARQFGGEVAYAQREGGGTTVSVLLPKLEVPADGE